MASESWMLGFVFLSVVPLSTKDLCKTSCQCQLQARVIEYRSCTWKIFGSRRDPDHCVRDPDPIGLRTTCLVRGKA